MPVMKCRGNWAAEVMSFLLIPRLFFYFSHVAVHFIPVVIQFFFSLAVVAWPLFKRLDVVRSFNTYPSCI